MEKLLTLEQLREWEKSKYFVRGGAPDDDEEETTESGAGTGDDSGAGEDSAGANSVDSQDDEGAADDSTDDTGAEDSAKAGDKGTAKPVRKDPTEGMTVEQQLEYYRKRSGHFEGEYKRERTKRQTLQKGTGLERAFTPERLNNEPKAPAKQLDEMTPKEFFDAAVAQARNETRAEMTEAQRYQRLRQSDAWARKEYDGSDGMPTYDEMIEEHVKPFIVENPDTFELLKRFPNPAQAAYTLGMLLNPQLQENGKRQTRQEARKELVKQIDAATKKAVTIKGGNGRQSNGKPDLWGMSDDDFEKEIAAAKDA